MQLPCKISSLYILYPIKKMKAQTKQEQEEKQFPQLIPANRIYKSYRKNKTIVHHTPLNYSHYLSQKYDANVYLKRQDLQEIRSFKIRGAATAIRSLTQQQKQRGVVTASAGNHAQGVAYCCQHYKIKGTIFMPAITPKLKIKSVQRFGGEWLTIVLIGTTFDDAVVEARKFEKENNSVFIPAFDDLKVIEGQGGLAVEILEDWKEEKSLDYVFVCVGGGGLAAGLVSYFAQMAPQVKLEGFQPLGSPSMYNSLKSGKAITLQELQTFVDGASIKKTGKIPYNILNSVNFPISLVDEGLVSTTMLQMYQAQAIILQPAGALAVCGLQLKKDQIKGKDVVCVLTGSNNDITRLSQIKLRSLIYLKKQAYYMVSSMIQINIKIFIQSIINPQENDIIFLNSAKKYNSSADQCLIGISFSKPNQKENKIKFQQRLHQFHYRYKQLTAKDTLLKILL